MVFVTGATGILGRVIVLELLKRGKTVRAAKRKTSDLAEVLHSFQFYTENPQHYFDQIQWIDVDFEDIDSLKSALQNVEEVYHCAALVSFHPSKKKEMYQTNISGTRNLLYACENSSVSKFCHVSSIAVLDGLNENGEMDEDSDYNPKLNHSAYAVSKHFSEMEVWRASAEGLNTVIVNPGIIIGSGNWNQSSGEIFSTFEKNNFTGCGGTSYVDVRDVAEICIQLLEKNIFGERFILISENWKYTDFGNKVRAKLGLKNLKTVSKTTLNFGILLNKLFGWIFPKLKMANRVNVDSICNFNKISNKKIIEKLNFQFLPISESIDFHLQNYIADKKAGKV